MSSMPTARLAHGVCGPLFALCWARFVPDLLLPMSRHPPLEDSPIAALPRRAGSRGGNELSIVPFAAARQRLADDAARVAAR